MGILYLLESIRNSLLDVLMLVITEFGAETAFMAVAITVFWCINKSYGYYIMTTGFAGTILNQFLKLACHIPRPWVLDESFTIVESAREGAAGYSFPSGHTQNAVATFGSMARWTENKKRRVAFCLIILLVAFSRMYLGVHTPLDVGVSLGIGIILVFVLYPVFRDMEKHPKTMYLIFFAMLTITLAYIIYAEVWPFPADIDAENLASGLKSGYTMLGAVSGVFLSYHLDRKYINFETVAIMSAQISKVIMGMGLLMLLRITLKAPLLALFSGSDVAHAVRYFIMVVFAGAVWPMTFRWFGSWGNKSKSTYSEV